MSLGRIYSYPQDPRVPRALVAAEYCNKKITHVSTDLSDKTAEFFKSGLFTKGTFVPAFYDDIAKMAVIESAGIPYHIAKLYDTSNQLLGKTKLDESSIAQWILYIDTNIWPHIYSLMALYHAYYPYSKEREAELVAKIKKPLDYLNKQLLNITYLGSENVALSDIIGAVSFYWLFTQFFEEKDRKEMPNLVRWFNTVVNQPEFKRVFKSTALCTKRMTVLKTKPVVAKSTIQTKPKKSDKPEKPVVADEAKEVKKKHPCEELPPSTMILDEWKRIYSNNDTRPTAIDWFWKNFDPTGYSVWHVEYKYGEELTKTFMTSNLIGGFYQRMERARKYAFGSLLVIGENDNNTIEGYFVFRGHEVLPEVVDAPDYPSFTFTKIDVMQQKSKFEDYLAWDGDSFKSRKCADGKIFK